MATENNIESGTGNRTFKIVGTFYKENCLPGLNDLLREAERHPMAYGKMKKEMEFIVMASIRRDLKGYKPSKKCRLDITWGEKSKGAKRDFDNVVSAGRKIINDALTKSGTIKDDNPNYLLYGKNKFVYTDKPFVRVEIVEVEYDTETTDN